FQFFETFVFHKRTPVRYLIPAGYVGWVQADYEVNSAPSLVREEGYDLVIFDAKGHFATSSGMKTGWAEDEYYYVKNGILQRLRNTPFCEGGMIWNQMYSDDGKDKLVKDSFFVGTEEAYRKFTDPSGHSYKPCETNVQKTGT